jgi:demethylmenaquinone methyltransferase/2-methoxy-6-polyprenyl-1,4-benzoquinol methylase
VSIESYYARRAREYERIYAKPERQEDLGTLRALVERTFAGKHVLEVACGTGYWTEVLARSVASVTAVDVNEEVLAVARAKGLGTVRFECADAYALPEFPRLFDAGLLAFWWSHIPKARLPSFRTGLHRVFTTDATIVFIDNVYVEGSSTPIARTDADGNTYQIRKLDDGSAHEVLKNFPTEKELRDTFNADVKVEWLTYYWIVSYKLT